MWKPSQLWPIVFISSIFIVSHFVWQLFWLTSKCKFSSLLFQPPFLPTPTFCHQVIPIWNWDRCIFVLTFFNQVALSLCSLLVEFNWICDMNRKSFGSRGWSSVGGIFAHHAWTRIQSFALHKLGIGILVIPASQCGSTKITITCTQFKVFLSYIKTFWMERREGWSFSI